MMENSAANTFTPGTKMNASDGKVRFALARKDIQHLLENYDEIKKGGGDEVRRWLGTVVEYQEAADSFGAYLFQAEGVA